MAKKKKIQETTIEDFYDLKVDKVDELVAALKDDTAEFDGEISMNINDCTGVYDPKNVKRSGKQKQFDPYKGDFLGRVPVCIKGLFIKFWFAGMVCYFIMFGISSVEDDLDKLVLLGAVLGLVVDILVNPALRFIETDKHEYNAYMMFPFPFKAFWTFFTNIIYYVIVVICVNYCYYGLDMLLNSIYGRTDYIAVGVEPLLFGVFAVMVDMVFIGIKDLIVFLAKKRKKEEPLNV